jgi:hypothetical protein
MTPPDKIEIRITLRHAIEEAIEKWRDEDVTAEPGILNMYSPDDVKMLARAIRDAIQEKPTMAPDARWQALKDYLNDVIKATSVDAEVWEGNLVVAALEARADGHRSTLAKMRELEAGK